MTPNLWKNIPAAPLLKKLQNTQDLLVANDLKS